MVFECSRGLLNEMCGHSKVAAFGSLHVRRMVK